jgi:hypothetical protein
MIRDKKNKKAVLHKTKLANEDFKEKSLNNWSQYKKLPKRIQEMPKTLHFTSLSPSL